MKLCTQKHQGKANTKIELGKLIIKVIKAIQNGFHSISNEYLAYPYQIWYTEATKQDKDLFNF